MPSADIVQIGLISLVLAVGIANFVYSHVLDPKSDIVFDSQVSSYPSAEHEDAEFRYNLYFSANNRGDDNGFVTSVSIKRLKFFDEEDDEPEILSGDELADGVYDSDPPVHLNKKGFT